MSGRPTAMQAMGNRQGKFDHRLLAEIDGIEDHQVACTAGAVPDQTEHPAIVFC